MIMVKYNKSKAVSYRTGRRRNTANRVKPAVQWLLLQINGSGVTLKAKAPCISRGGKGEEKRRGDKR
jgi:hypothetical protein